MGSARTDYVGLSSDETVMVGVVSVGGDTVGCMALEIEYVIGDATSPNGVGTRIVAHVCNDAGGWGKGFVVAVSRRWPAPEAAYRSWYRGRVTNDFALGAVQLVPVAGDLYVANMIGQHGYRPSPGDPPVRYQAIESALGTLGEKALGLGATVHMPRIGCGLAGGRWELIEPLIVKHLAERGVAVTVYDLP
jgi:O-acetyl-ADP-ribose deacetylase (regulator of RNase III)